jgi:hypothetical protein
MRTFYKQILERTYEIFGVSQLAKMDDDQIVFLLDALERVSSLYNYISEDDQKTIINKRLITDKDYNNINARLIATWFEQDGKIFFKEVAHKETKEYQPATDEQKAFWLEEWRKQLNSITSNFEVRPVSHAELMRERLHGQEAKPTGYKPMSNDEVIKKNLHNEYIKTNYDPITGNALETWIPEDEWLKKQK